MIDTSKLRDRVVAAQEAARLVEREFLLARGWEDQGIFNGVTWWSYKGKTNSSAQPAAVNDALRGIKDRFYHD